MAVWEVSFPGGVGNENIKWRALIWAMSEGLLILSVAISYLPPKVYSGIFKFGIVVMMLDFFLCVIWLPIGVSKTYGFRSAKDVFTATCMSAELTFCVRVSFHFRQWNRRAGRVELALMLVCV
jgi:hypothetical protein